MKDVVATIQVSAVPAPVVDVVWPAVKDMLQKAIETTLYDVYGLDDVYAALQNGELALWVVMDGTVPIAAFTSRICDYPKGRGLAIDWMGGTRMKEWFPMVQNAMERYGKDNGCTHLEGYGRRAWGRVLQKYGWAPAHIVYKMDLADG